MKKVFEIPSILLESFQTEETVMTEKNPWDEGVMSVGFDWGE